MTILILTNHSYMLWQFRRELIGTLLEKHRVFLCMPFVGHEDDFAAMGAECIPADLERREKIPSGTCGFSEATGRSLNRSVRTWS